MGTRSLRLFPVALMLLRLTSEVWGVGPATSTPAEKR
jgi:hypothetical protein